MPDLDLPDSVAEWFSSQPGESCRLVTGTDWGRRLIVKGSCYVDDPETHDDLMGMAADPPPGWTFWRGLSNMRHTRSLLRIDWRMEFMESERALTLKRSRSRSRD